MSEYLTECLSTLEGDFPNSGISSIIKADRAGFLGRRKGTAGRRKGTAGRRKPPQGATLISMRERRALIGRKAYVHPVTYTP